MTADFVPESMALGGMFAAGADGAVLLALLIGRCYVLKIGLHSNNLQRAGRASSRPLSILLSMVSVE